MAWTKGSEQTSNANKALLRPRFVTLSEITVNSNNKALVYDTDIAEGSAFEIVSVRCEYTATGTAGARRPTQRIFNTGGDIIREHNQADDVAAGATLTSELSRGIAVNGTTANPTLAKEAFPHEFLVLPGQTIRFLDAQGVDAADDMVMHVSGYIHP